MRKFFAIALLATLMVSCKKSSSSSATNTITATIDGTNYVFNQRANVQINNQGSYNIVSISAFNGSTISAGGITIDLQVLGATAAKNYPENGNTNNEYSNVSYASDYSSGNFYSGGSSPTNPVSVTVTSVTSTNIQGTFTGDIYLNGDNTQTKKTVTNGTFNININ